MIYFDQAASSFPKPPVVGEYMLEAINNYAANPGRGGHKLTNKASKVINDTREKAAELFGSSDPKRCLFYINATVALNQAIKGFEWEEGDHIVSTTYEHNSVRRPLEFIKKTKGVKVTYVDWLGDKDNFIKSVEQAITNKTKMIVTTHASNVTGVVLPIKEINTLARDKGIKTLVDASQTAGHMKINMQKDNIDMLAFPGHKGLLGPQGTGMLLVEEGISLTPILHGGTGEASESVDQPDTWPSRMESGTLNTPGIAGLFGAFEAYEERMEENVPRETKLAKQLYSCLEQIDGIILYSPKMTDERMPVIAFNIEHIDSEEVAMILDTHYNIAVRAGLHCSPLTHEALKTIDQGVIRASVGIYNTEQEVETFIEAIKEITLSYKGIE